MNLTFPSSNTDPRPTTDRPHTILAVDDEPMIRDCLSMVLQSAGYKVLLAESGVQALTIARAHQGQTIDLLVTDLSMPGMDGTELATELRAERPQIKTLFMSGYSPEECASLSTGFPGSAWITKPFQFGAVCDAIHALLNPNPI